MSFYRENIFAFIQVLEKNSSLFTEQDKTGLNKLLRDFTGNAEKFSKEISAWYEDLPEIKNVQNIQLKMLKSISDESLTRGPGGSRPKPIPKDKELVRLLENAIRRLSQPTDQHKDKTDDKT